MGTIKKIAIACDHGGMELKAEIIKYIQSKGYEYTDFGTHSTESCDYPDYAVPACDAVLAGDDDAAILICGTGIGMSLAANKVKGIRAAVCGDTFSAEYTRKHNNANALCLGARVIGTGLALEIVEKFLTSEFEGGRHQTRIDKVMAIEKRD